MLNSLLKPLVGLHHERYLWYYQQCHCYSLQGAPSRIFCGLVITLRSVWRQMAGCSPLLSALMLVSFSGMDSLSITSGICSSTCSAKLSAHPGVVQKSHHDQEQQSMQVLVCSCQRTWQHLTPHDHHRQPATAKRRGINACQFVWHA